MKNFFKYYLSTIIVVCSVFAVNQISDAARNGSGTYVIPNLAVSGEVISSSDYNENFDDVGDEITNSLPRDGQAGMTGQFKATAGTAAAPSITFTADSNTGFYSSAADTIGITANGVNIGSLSSAGLTITGALTASGGVTGVVPTGLVLAYAGSTPPTGYLMMYGQCESRTTYSDLFTLIGTTYDNGCLSTEFGIPDLRGRVIAGQDDMNASGGSGTSANRLTNLTNGVNGDTLGGSGGLESFTLATTNIPAHTHTFSATTASNGAHTHTEEGIQNNTTANAGPERTIVSNDTNNTSSSGSHTHTVSGTSDSTGSTTALGHIQPTIILNYIIKY